DPVDTLSVLKYTLQAAIEAARILKSDADRAKKWRHVLDHYPPYPFYDDQISPLQGLRKNHINHVRTLQGLFPCGELDPTIAPQHAKLCRAEWKRTDFWCRFYACNKGIIRGYTGITHFLGMNALWLGLRDEAWTYFEDFLKTDVKPSGLIAHNAVVLVNTKRS